MDALEELMEEKEEETKKSKSVPVVATDKPVKVLVTPVKKSKRGSSMGVYIDEQTDSKKTLEFALSKFEQINKKAPTEDDKERLKEFSTTGLLFEAEMDTEQVADVPFDDEEEDEEYL